MRKRLNLMVACLLLSGCNTMMSEHDAADARALCLSAGFQGDALAQCTVSRYEHAQDARAARIQATGNALQQYSQQLREEQERNRARFTNCTAFGNQVQCVTQ